MTSRRSDSPHSTEGGEGRHAPRVSALMEATIRKRNALKRLVARRLRAALDERGWSLGDAARAASRHLPEGRSLARAHLSGYTRARHLPGPIYAEALAKALGMEPSELFFGNAPDVLPNWRRPAAPPETKEQLAEEVRVFDRDGEALIDIRGRVPWPTALEILRMLQEARSSGAAKPGSGPTM